MRTKNPHVRRVTQAALRISLMVMIILQCSVLTAMANKNVFVRWGTDTNWNGDGGSVSSTNKIVTNNGNTAFGNTDSPAFTITPQTGYIISNVEWKDNDSNGFTPGNGTTLTPNSSKQVTFTMTNNNCSLQVTFAVDPNAAQRSFIAYYGTGPIDNTAATAPNWIGGSVYRVSGTTYNQIGTSSYTVNTYSNTGTKTVHITPGTSPGYTIAAVKYCEATWHDPRSVTVIGPPISVSPDGNGEFTFTATSPKSYIIFVQFALIGATGGKIGAWYGTNNSLDYDATTATPPNANGSGGTIWITNPGSSQLANRAANGATITSNSTVTIEVRPAANFKITSISYGDTTPSSSVTVPANQTSNMSFTFPVAGGHNYVVWVVFTSTAASSFTVSGTVDPATDASCTSNSITPTSQVININQTGSFVLSTSTNCTIESVNFNGAGAQAWVGTGNTYTTPAITATRSFVVKFKPVGFDILAEIDSTSPSGCGTISPSGTNNYVRGSNTPFTITTSATCTVNHVWVTDTNKGYATDTDIAPLPGSTYTFTNLQAAGHIKVKFSTVVPATSDAYCQIPPFVAGQASLAPNVLIVFDNSGSMGGNDSDGYAYYTRKTYDCTSTSILGSGPCAKFYGYFDPATMYKADSSNANKYLINLVTLNLSQNGSTSGSTTSYSGNYLNFRNMHKVDVIRKALSGGKVVDRTAATKFLATDNGKTVEYGTTLPTGIIQSLSGKVRFGVMVFNNPAEGGHLAAVPTTTRKAVLGSSEADLVAVIESSETDPMTSTPIAETLYEAIRYYQAKPSAYNSGVDYATMDPVQNSCQKHFILLLTDGEPNSNNNLPGLSTHPSLNGYTDSVLDVNTWENMIPTNDRASNTNSTCSSMAFGSSTNSEKVEAVAFYAHNTDLRSSVYGNDKEGVQNITIYPVYAFGDGSGTKTLHMAAKYGGYVNKNGNAPSPNTWPSPDQQNEWDDLKNITNYDCKPYNYFEADDGAVLENSIYSAMSDILAKVSSGTAASILSNSEGSGANLLQAVFYPNRIFTAPTSSDVTTEASWIGELQNLWYYVDPFIANSSVREDTDFSTTTPYHVMNLRNDYVARFYFTNAETKVELKQDTNGDGLGDTMITEAEDPDLVKSIWRAGKLLWSHSADTRTIHTSVDGYSLLLPTEETPPKGGFYTASPRAAALQPYLQAADNDSNAEAIKIINYIRGTDQTSYRNRKVSMLSGGSTVTSEWKLGDIVASTPRIQSTNKQNSYNIDSPAGYGDKSYGAFISSSNYKSRGMVYAGANDGMLHAFKLGKLTVDGVTEVPKTPSGFVSISGDVKATLTGTNLGVEQWAYIPRNTLPYLKYLTDAQNYKHLYYVDGPTVISDVAVGNPSTCSASDYSDCVKDESGGTNWKTILIGSMGLGGASRLKGTSTCFDDFTVTASTCVKSPIFDPTDTAATKTKGVGYSSYFALDISGQYFNSDGSLANQPTLKWEFPPAGAANDFGLGYATSGAAIVRISTKKTDPNDSTKLVADTTKNGKWFAVFASGPTGPIDSTLHRFMGKSDQNLKLFVVDMGATIDATHPFALGTNYWVINTGIQRAFGGSVVNASIDADRWNKSLDGNYQDDALYVGYTKASIADSAPITTTTTWTDGGVIRVLTKEDINPANWTVSPVISGIGPVTTAISRLQDRKNKKLWLYFGTGRFYYGGDDASSQRYIMGVQDRCYTTSNAIDKSCAVNTASDDNPGATGKGAALALSNLQPQTTTISTTLPNDMKGWYIALDGEDVTASMGAERSITDAVAVTNGAVFLTTFKPTSDVCKFGGDSYLWGVKYDTGGVAPAAALNGKALVQVSTGAFEEVTLGTALTAADGRKMGVAMTGKPPSDPPPVVTNASNKPAKKILHLQEK